MATKIRLQRHGRKGYAYYHIVIADSRTSRNGKPIERIGSYNPNTNPATVELKFDRALYWVQTGAQPTDTTRNILSEEGVMLKKHLLEGVKKGAFDETVAEKRFEEWKSAKMANIQKTKEQLATEKAEAAKKRLADEKEKHKAKVAELAKKKAEALATEVAEAQAANAAEASSEETPAVENAE